MPLEDAARVRRHPDQRHPPLHGHPGADPAADRPGPDHGPGRGDGVQNLRLHQPHHSGRGPGEVAPGLPGGGRAPAGAHYPGAGPAGEGAASRPGRGHSRRKRTWCTWPTWTSTTASRSTAWPALHTEILEKSELKAFAQTVPGEVQQQDQRHHLPPVAAALQPGAEPAWITRSIGDGLEEGRRGSWKGCWHYQDDEAALDRLLAIKQENKRELCRVPAAAGRAWTLDEHSIFDIQIKRLHEYKRQQMNALYVIHKYLEIKAGHLPQRPVTVLFGAKAAPAYTIAKDIIHLILCLQELIDHDPDVQPLAEGGHGGELQRDLGGEADPRLRHLRADLPGLQGGQRHRQHEVHAQRGGHPGHRWTGPMWRSTSWWGRRTSTSSGPVQREGDRAVRDSGRPTAPGTIYGADRAIERAGGLHHQPRS